MYCRLLHMNDFVVLIGLNFLNASQIQDQYPDLWLLMDSEPENTSRSNSILILITQSCHKYPTPYSLSVISKLHYILALYDDLLYSLQRSTNYQIRVLGRDMCPPPLGSIKYCSAPSPPSRAESP